MLTLACALGALAAVLGLPWSMPLLIACLALIAAGIEKGAR